MAINNHNKTPKKHESLCHSWLYLEVTQVLSQNKNLETGFQNPESKSTVEFVGTSSEDVLTVMLGSANYLDFC